MCDIVGNVKLPKKSRLEYRIKGWRMMDEHETDRSHRAVQEFSSRTDQSGYSIKIESFGIARKPKGDRRKIHSDAVEDVETEAVRALKGSRCEGCVVRPFNPIIEVGSCGNWTDRG